MTLAAPHQSQCRVGLPSTLVFPNPRGKAKLPLSYCLTSAIAAKDQSSTCWRLQRLMEAGRQMQRELGWKLPVPEESFCCFRLHHFGFPALQKRGEEKSPISACCIYCSSNIVSHFHIQWVILLAFWVFLLKGTIAMIFPTHHSVDYQGLKWKVQDNWWMRWRGNIKTHVPQLLPSNPPAQDFRVWQQYMKSIVRKEIIYFLSK